MISKIIKYINMPVESKIDVLIRKIITPIESKLIWRNNLGSNSLIRKPLMVNGKKYIQVGNNVTIRSGARIECISEWNGVKYKPQLVIGDNVTVEENLHIACAEKVIIRHDVTISFDVMIMDNEHTFKKNTKIFDTPLKTSPVIIGEYTFIGAGVKILKGVKIGRNCVIGAGAVVTRDVFDGSIVTGIPARVR